MGQSSYPEQLDTDLELPRVEGNVTEIGGDAINSLRDAVFSIESAVGISPQGNTASLAARVGVSIDSDGNIKPSALAAVGLVTLPITNSQISGTADIAESKLDLEFGTAFLNSKVNSVITNLDALTDAVNNAASDFFLHFTGAADRHDGYQIDLQEPVKEANEIETAIHKLDIIADQHSALITDIQLSVTELQTAVSEISDFESILTDTIDNLHDSAVALNTRGEQSSQGNLVETTLASTIFQTDTSIVTNILQVMRPNVARVTGKTPSLSSLEIGVADTLSIQAGGLSRGTLAVDLSSAIPTENLDDIVVLINSTAQLASNHYPISAYNVNGKLTIAHNIPGSERTIEIVSVAQSAASVLGFGDIVDVPFNTFDDAYHSAFVGGKKITDMKPLLAIRYDHSSGALDEIHPVIGDLLELFDVPTDREARIICNILNHDTDDSANGTYYIRDIIGSGNVAFRLNTNIPYGEFDIEIVADAVNFDSSGLGQLFDIFLEAAEDGYDGYGIVTKSLRLGVVPFPGIVIKAVSKDFPFETTFSRRITGFNTLELFHDGEFGVPVSIPNGYLGEIQAFLPDNINSALFEVIGNISLNGSLGMFMEEFAGNDDRLHLSSVHYGGTLGTDSLGFVMDKRQLGTAPETQFKDVLAPKDVNDALKELRNNGVIRGFDVISNTTTSIKVRGGRVLVGGKIVDVETKDVTIDSFTGDIRLLALDENGLYKAFDSDESGYSIDELTEGDSYGDNRNLVPIVEFGTTGSALDGTFSDKRLFVSKLDKRVHDSLEELDNRIAALEGGGSLWGFTETATTDPSGSFISLITLSSNSGLTALDDTGFTTGTSIDRRFEFTDANATKEHLFKSSGMTHINVMAQFEYGSVSGGSPFGTNGDVDFQLGIVAITGIANNIAVEEYATVKSIVTSVLPSNTVTEQYVASIPISLLGLNDNIILDTTARIKILGSEFIDGTNGAPDPRLRCGKIRIITSSYSIAGDVLGQDGTNTLLATNLGDVL